MSVTFARYLYVPEDGTRHSSQVATSIEEALRDAGLAVGPDGEGTNWRPFRPSGALVRYAERLGLVYPTISVDWHDEVYELVDTYLPPRGPWSRCPSCAKLLPSHGTMIHHPVTGEEVLVQIEVCGSCGEPFDPLSWARAEERVVFRSRLVVSLQADAWGGSLPAFAEGCPELVKTIQEVVGQPVREVFVAG